MICRCSVCKKEKDSVLFYKSKTNKNGVSSRCIVCTKLVAKEWKNKNREKVLIRRREIYQQDKEKIELQNRAWELRNPEKVYLTRKIWKQNNKERCRQYKYTRRAREHKNGGRITSKEIKSLFEFYKYKCLSCGKKDKNITLDHVIPLALRGENSILNAQPLCLSCNDKKGIKIIDYRNKYQIHLFQIFLQKEVAMG